MMNFRAGVRRKFSTTATSETSTISTTISRPTKIKQRRKYLMRSTTKRIESQESTTPRLKADNRFRFVSRRPYLRSTPKQEYQTVVSGNQPILDNDQHNQPILDNDQLPEKSTEISDFAMALQSIQKAPLPKETLPEITSRSPQTTIRNIKKGSRVTLTTPRNYNRIKAAGTRPHIIVNRPILSTFSVPYSSPQPTDTFSTSPAPLFISFVSTAPVQRAPYRRVTPPSVSKFYSPSSDYDFYQTAAGGTLTELPKQSKVLLHSNGVIECLDQGNFPHPVSCKKFISCAEMGAGKVLGWEYTCPKNLSFDPIGGICNWSAGLGCEEQ
ncbi:hypothetical protein JTB14_011054 [Gonioctena quinquepunctata]|nr:hypothetical protein JTB14_011054 [Gonioctena quinquepunctata]